MADWVGKNYNKPKMINYLKKEKVAIMEGGRLVDCDAMDQGCEIVKNSEDCVRTPLLRNVEELGLVEKIAGVHVHLKLESMQCTGSFKARGVASQMAHLPEAVRSGGRVPITMSAGNYGKTFAHACKGRGLKGVVVMPETAPDSRQVLIEASGCDVKRVPSRDLMKTVNGLVKEQGMIFLHPFDDVNIIAGYTSVAAEILDDVDPDIVLVCCGGGGLTAGIATGLRLRGCTDCRVYGVEPETANAMQLSFEQGHAVDLPTASSVAPGLAPPFAGRLCYEHLKKFATGILTVSEREIASATRLLCSRGLLVEPSGAAAFASLVFNKVPDLRGNVVVVVTGGNATPAELDNLFKTFDV